MMQPPSLLPPPPVVVLPVPHKTTVQPPVPQPDNTTDTFTPISKQAKPKPTWQPWAIGAGIVATVGVIAITQREHLQGFISKLFPKAESATVPAVEKTLTEVPKPENPTDPLAHLPEVVKEQIKSLEQDANPLREQLRNYCRETLKDEFRFESVGGTWAADYKKYLLELTKPVLNIEIELLKKLQEDNSRSIELYSTIADLIKIKQMIEELVKP